MENLKIIKKHPPLGYLDIQREIDYCNKQIEVCDNLIERRIRRKEDPLKFIELQVKLEQDKKLYQLTLLN